MTSENEKTELLKENIGKIKDLPTLPQVVAEITRLMQDPNVNAEQVSKAISMDQAISSKVLKMVNSAFYGFPGKISSISHAIVILGFNTVKNIVMMASVFEKLGNKGDLAGFEVGKLWLHSVATGVLAGCIIQETQNKKLENVFLGGLLHDIGKVILLKYLHDEMEWILSVQKKKELLFVEAENKTIGITHADIGGWLCDTWNLPEELRACIAFHHEPEKAGEHKLITSAIHVADILARSLIIGSGGDNRIPRVNPEVWDSFDLNQERIEAIFKRAEPELNKASNFLKSV